MKLSKPCKCGAYGVVYIGIQEFLDCDYRLYNCVRCKTTRSKKINLNKRSHDEKVNDDSDSDYTK